MEVASISGDRATYCVGIGQQTVSRCGREMVSPNRLAFPLHWPVCKLGGTHQFIPFLPSHPFSLSLSISCYSCSWAVLCVGALDGVGCSGLNTGVFCFVFPVLALVTSVYLQQTLLLESVSRFGNCGHRRQVYKKMGDGGIGSSTDPLVKTAEAVALERVRCWVCSAMGCEGGSTRYVSVLFICLVGYL
ncbi:hypothetical protein VTG60DRAFT_5726 [Thermothelomyces hinnuleus]